MKRIATLAAAGALASLSLASIAQADRGPSSPPDCVFSKGTTTCSTTTTTTVVDPGTTSCSRPAVTTTTTTTYTAHRGAPNSDGRALAAPAPRIESTQVASEGCGTDPPPSEGGGGGTTEGPPPGEEPPPDEEEDPTAAG